MFCLSVCGLDHTGQTGSEPPTQRTTQLVYSMQAGRMVSIFSSIIIVLLLYCKENISAFLTRKFLWAVINFS